MHLKNETTYQLVFQHVDNYLYILNIHFSPKLHNEFLLVRNIFNINMLTSTSEKCWMKNNMTFCYYILRTRVVQWGNQLVAGSLFKFVPTGFVKVLWFLPLFVIQHHWATNISITTKFQHEIIQRRKPGHSGINVTTTMIFFIY